MSKLSTEEEKLLREFLERKHEAARQSWIQENRALFQPPPEQRGKMTVHSGGILGSNRRDAEAHCQRYNAAMLEHTSGGKILEAADLYRECGREQADRLFKTASGLYMEVVEGRLRAFSLMARVDRVMLVEEIPKAIHDKKLTHINEVRRWDLLKIWHNDQASEKLYARGEILVEINQGIKLIEWQGEHKRGHDANQQDQEKGESISQRVPVYNNQGEKRYIEITGLKPDDNIQGLELSKEHSRKIDQLKPDEIWQASIKEIRESITREQTEQQQREQHPERTR